MIVVMSTSLKVVSMAAVFWASLRWRAMVCRSLVMRTRSSRAASSAGDGARTWIDAAGWATTTGDAAARSIAASMSPLVTRPAGPVPGTDCGAMPDSAASRRTDGATGASAAGFGASFTTWGAGDGAGAAGAALGGGGAAFAVSTDLAGAALP